MKNNKKYQAVFTAHNMLLAVVLQEVLERMGIPASLDYKTIRYEPGHVMNDNNEIKILVPCEWAEEVQHLLAAKPPAGEIFCVP